MSGISRRSLGERVRPVLVALVAGGLYGSWAGFAHHRLGFCVALRAGLTQFALSLTATLVLALVLERLFRWQSNPLQGFWFAAGGTSMLGTAWLIVGHALAGTPHIAVTITPPMIVGAVLSFAYSRALFMRATRGGEPAARLPIRRQAHQSCGSNAPPNVRGVGLATGCIAPKQHRSLITPQKGAVSRIDTTKWSYPKSSLC